MELPQFLEGTAFGEFLRQLASADGETYHEKIHSLEQQLIQQERDSRGSPYFTQIGKLRFFVAGLSTLEQNSFLAPHESETALAA